MQTAIEWRPVTLPSLYSVGSDSSAGVICVFVYTVLICAFVLDMFFYMHQAIYLNLAA